MQAEVIAFQDECTRDLAAAEPIIKEAEAALNSLDKASLGELKSFGSPAAEVVQVVSSCMVLTAPGGKIPKVGRCLDGGNASALPPLWGVLMAAGAQSWQKCSDNAASMHSNVHVRVCRHGKLLGTL